MGAGSCRPHCSMRGKAALSKAPLDCYFMFHENLAVEELHLYLVRQ